MHPTAAVVAAVDKWLADAYTTVRGTTRPAVPTVQWLANIRATFMQGSPSQAVQVRLALIDGTSGGGVATAAALEASGAKVVSLHWRSDLQAILPGFHGGSGGPSGQGAAIFAATGRCSSTHPWPIRPKRCGLGKRRTR